MKKLRICRALACFAGLFWSLDLWGVSVLKVNDAQSMMAIAQGTGRKWQVGDILCAQKDGVDVACGPVTKATARGAIVKFNFQTGDKIEVGDNVVFKTAGALPTKEIPEPKKDSVESDLQSLNGELPATESDSEWSLEETKDSQEKKDPSAPSKESQNKKEQPVASSVSDRPFEKPRPKFHALFDWWLTYKPGREASGVSVTFDSFHTLLLMEVGPYQNVTFGFEVSPSPRYYEIDWKLSRVVTLRFGRIYVPFDDLSPHSYFGGRANVTRVSQTDRPGDAFLPELFTDLGVALKFNFVDSANFSLESQLYVVNGFQSGGTSPGNDAVYPNFGEISCPGSTCDNNSDKSVGGRLQVGFFRNALSVGSSVYYGRYSGASEPYASLLMAGVDGRLKFAATEIRGGYAFMTAGVHPEDSFVRGGFYLELAQFFGRFRLSATMGQSQNDSRVIQNTDQTIVGGALAYRTGGVQLSMEHSRDLNEVRGKTYYSFSGLRLNIML